MPPQLPSVFVLLHCRVICVLHNGEMLGESRLLMDETALRQGPPPMRNATVTASGHVVLLTMSTDMARECFKGDVLEQLRGLGKARLDMRESSPAWLAGKRGGAADSVGEGDTAQVCYDHPSRNIFLVFPQFSV